MKHTHIKGCYILSYIGRSSIQKKLMLYIFTKNCNFQVIFYMKKKYLVVLKAGDDVWNLLTNYFTMFHSHLKMDFNVDFLYC